MSLSSSYSYYYYMLGFASLKGQLGLRIVKSSRNSLGRQGKSWQRRRPKSLLPTQSGLSWSTQKWEKTMATPYPPLPSPHGLHPFRGLTLTHQSVGPWGREYKSEWTHGTNLDLLANIERERGDATFQGHINSKIKQFYLSRAKSWIQRICTKFWIQGMRKCTVQEVVKRESNFGSESKVYEEEFLTQMSWTWTMM